MLLATILAMGRLGRIAALVWLTLRMRPLSLKTFLSQRRARRTILATQDSRV